MRKHTKFDTKAISLITIIVILLVILTQQYKILKVIRTDFGNTLMLISWELNDNLQYIKKGIEMDSYSDDEIKIIQQLIRTCKNISEAQNNITVSKVFEKMDASVVGYFNGNIQKDELYSLLKELLEEIEDKIIYNSDPLYYYDLNYKQLLKSRM